MRQIDIVAMLVHDHRFAVDSNRRDAVVGVSLHRETGVLGKANTAKKQQRKKELSKNESDRKECFSYCCGFHHFVSKCRTGCGG